MRGSGGSAALGAVLLMLVTAGTPLAFAGPTQAIASIGPAAAPTAWSSGHTIFPAPGGWTPANGRDYPGMPHFRMTTVSRSAGSCALDYGPGWLAYDAADDALWVATPPDCIGVFPVTNLSASASILVGSDPFGVAVDNTTNEVFVTNTGSDSVSVINASSEAVVATVEVGSAPMGVAYDPTTGDVYVANSGSDNVSVISGTTLGLVATIAVGTAPVGVAADPASGQVFVANNGSDNVSVVSETTYGVVATVPAGSGPWGVAVDNSSDEVFVTNSASSNITVISAPSDVVVATIPVLAPGITLQGATYDAATGMVWIGGGYLDAVVVNATSRSVDGYLGLDPSGVTYDPGKGEVCMTEVGNFSLGCVAPTWVEATVPLTFLETGLPAATPWTVAVPGGSESSSTDNVTFGIIPSYLGGPYNASYSIPRANGYIPEPGSGGVLVDARPVQVNVTFIPGAGYYEVNFTETGLAAGQSWAVTLGGTVSSTWGTTDSFWEPNGTFAFTVALSGGQPPDPSNGTVVVNGSARTVPIAFGAPPATFQVEFTESGLLPSTVWSVTFNGALLSSNRTAIAFSAQNGSGYPYSVAEVGAALPAPPNGTLDVAGANVTVPIVFTSTVSQIYPVWFNESGLPLGTLWRVTVSGVEPWSGHLTNSSSGSSMIAYFQAGEQATFNVSEPTGYTATPEDGQFVVPAHGPWVIEVIVFTKNSTGGGPPPSPSILSFSATPNPSILGNPVTFSVIVQGGALPLAYRYAGLPAGCVSVNASSLSCIPNGTGNWSVQVAVTDTMGRSAASYAPVSVEPPPVICCQPPPRAEHVAPTFLGLPGTQGYWLFGGLLTVGLLAVGLDLLRRSRGGSDGARR